LIPLFVNFERRFRTDLKAVTAGDAFGLIGDDRRMIAARIDLVGRKDQDIDRAYVVAAQPATLADVLENLNLSHKSSLF
jgi:hypothetical protein